MYTVISHAFRSLLQKTQSSAEITPRNTQTSQNPLTRVGSSFVKLIPPPQWCALLRMVNHLVKAFPGRHSHCHSRCVSLMVPSRQWQGQTPWYVCIHTSDTGWTQDGGKKWNHSLDWMLSLFQERFHGSRETSSIGLSIFWERAISVRNCFFRSR